MRSSEENGAEVDAIGLESRLEVPLLPTEIEGVARVAGYHDIQVRRSIMHLNTVLEESEP